MISPGFNSERRGFINGGKFANGKARFHQAAHGNQQITRPVAKIRAESDVSCNDFRFHCLQIELMLKLKELDKFAKKNLKAQIKLPVLILLLLFYL